MLTLGDATAPSASADNLALVAFPSPHCAPGDFRGEIKVPVIHPRLQAGKTTQISLSNSPTFQQPALIYQRVYKAERGVGTALSPRQRLLR